MEYAVLYWAAACLVNWAGRSVSGVTGRQLDDAVNMVCDEADMTIQQEGLLKMLLWKLMKKGVRDGAEGSD